MTIERIDGELVFRCDGKRCAEMLATGENNLTAAVWFLHEANWIFSLSHSNSWLHTCPACYQAELKDTL